MLSNIHYLANIRVVIRGSLIRRSADLV